MSALAKKSIKVVEGSMYLLTIVSCITIPFIMDSSLINPFVLPKQFVLMFVAVVGFGLWLVRAVLTKKISFYQSVFDKIFAPLCGALLLSVFFSSDRFTSLVGRADYFVTSLLFFIACWLLFTFFNHTITSLPRWQGIIDTLMGVGTISALGVAAKVLANVDAFSFLTNGRWSTIDTTNSLLGVWLLTIFLIAASQLVKKDSPTTKTILCVVTMVATFTVLLIMNYTVIWWLLILGLLLFIGVSSLYINEVRLGVLTGFFGIVVGIIIMMIMGTPQLTVTTVPAEVVLNNSSSWTIAQGSIFSGLKNSVVGNGLGTFLLAFSNFRDSSFNSDPYAWSVRFNQPSSTFVAFVTEGGLVLTGLFILLVLYILGCIIQALKHAHAKQGGTIQIFSDGSVSAPPLVEALLLGAVWVVVTIGMFLFFYGPVMWWVWWVLLSCVVVGLSFSESGLFFYKEHRLADKPEYTLSLSFVAISIVALMVVGTIQSTRWYLGEAAFARAHSSDDPATVESELRSALSYNNRNEQFHIALARLYILKATQLSQQTKPDIQMIGKLIEQAVSESRQATDLAPNSVMVWENLGIMYENAASLIPEARNWAIKSYEQASRLEPTNPVLASKLADNQARNGNLNEAMKKLIEAIALKHDYIPAYVSLGLVYEQLKDIDKATQTYATLVSLEPTNIDYAYNYGRLLYNRNTTGDRALAEQIWLSIVAAEPRYSNALYSMALMHETAGRRGKALEYYKKVLELNPGNKDIKTKITNLSR